MQVDSAAGVLGGAVVDDQLHEVLCEAEAEALVALWRPRRRGEQRAAQRQCVAPQRGAVPGLGGEEYARPEGVVC